MTEIEYARVLDEINACLHHHQPQGAQKLAAYFDQHPTFDARAMYFAFGMCSRWFAKDLVGATADSALLYTASIDNFEVIPRWRWRDLARCMILLRYTLPISALYSGEDSCDTPETRISALQKLFNSADVQEAALLMQSLAFLPCVQDCVMQAREAVRSNVIQLFSAVAHDSPIAQRFFDDNSWNQLVLKAAFLAQPIHAIVGVRERNNAELVDMLKDYIRERQAASRELPWDIWAPIAWLADDDDALNYLQQQCSNLPEKSQAAIVLALHESTMPQAKLWCDQLQQSMAIPLYAQWSDIAALSDSIS